MGSISACLMFFCLITYIQYSTADTYGYDNENTVQAYIKRALNAVHDSYQNLLNLVYEQQEKIGKGHYWRDTNIPNHNIDDRVLFFTWLILGYIAARIFSVTTGLMTLSFTLICYMYFGPLWCKHILWTVANKISNVSFLFDEMADRPLVSAVIIFAICLIKILYDAYHKSQSQAYMEGAQHKMHKIGASVESIKINHDRLMDSLNELHNKIDKVLLANQGMSSRRS